MTPDERQLLAGLFDRVRSATSGPKDAEAEAFINDAMRANPSAGYALSQTVLIQQQALEAAAKRISELDAQSKGGGAPREEGSFLGNLGRSLFGGAAPSGPGAAGGYDAHAYERDPGPPPGYAQQRPGYAPPPPSGGPWGGAQPQYAQQQPQGGGFLRGAMQTATGVAGGVLLGDAIGSLFGGHAGGGGGLFGGGLGGGLGGVSPRETTNETVNNYYGSDPAGQHAEDVLQDQDQDQDAAQDAFDDGGSGGGGDDYA